MGFKYLLKHLHNNFNSISPVFHKSKLFISVIDGNYIVYDILNNMVLKDPIEETAHYFVKRCIQQTRRVHRSVGGEIIQIIVFDGKAPIKVAIYQVKGSIKYSSVYSK